MQIGSKLPTEAVAVLPLLLIGAGQFSPSFSFESDGIEYALTVGADRFVNYISVSDTSFSTPEGIRVGENAASVMRVSKAAVVKETGWAFYVCLTSGWNAAFVQGNTMTEGTLNDSTKVSFLFKR